VILDYKEGYLKSDFCAKSDKNCQRMVDIIPSSQMVIGNGAFSIVYRAKLKSAPSNVVAIKAITKKNLAKSQNLLGKEIKILKVMLNINFLL